jgi:hypothetical protein
LRQTSGALRRTEGKIGLAARDGGEKARCFKRLIRMARRADSHAPKSTVG